MLEHFDPLFFFISIIIVVFAIGIHEFCHAKFADLAGDPTPRMMGRVTLNPIAHLDPIGSIMFLLSSITGVGIGWGKPVMVRPEKMRNPRWDHFVSVAAGPLSNLLQAAIYAIVLRMLMSSGQVAVMDVIGVFDRSTRDPFTILLTMGTLINLGLFTFNLIPIGPLDGHWLVGTFLPDPARVQWYQFNRGIGRIIFLILVFIPAGSQFDLLGIMQTKILLPLFQFFVPLVR